MIRAFIRKFALLAVIICAAAFCTSFAYASADHYPIGEIAFMEGSAKLHKNGNTKSLKTGDPIYLGNLIETEEDSKVLLLFIDDTRITLAENSELTVDEFIFDPYDSEENKGRFSVMKGAFYWVSGMLPKREEPDVEINNSYGSIGIRGTQFWSGEINKGYGVFVDEGLVGFSGTWGSAELPGGSSTFITQASAVQGEEFWNDKRRAKAKQKVTFDMAKELDKRLSILFKENIRKRHDYRGQMFPYKENPFRPKPVPEEEDDFFSEEFQEMKERNKQ